MSRVPAIEPGTRPELAAQEAQISAARGQIDLVATIAAYNMVSRFLVALHIGH